MLTPLVLVSLAHAGVTLLDRGLVLTAPSSGSFTGGVNAPTVEYDRINRTYVMYFESAQASWPSTCANSYAIGRATSTNGVNWSVDISPVLQGDAVSGSNRECGVSQPAVVFDGTTWHLFYSQSRARQSSSSTSNENGGIGYATSTDGVNFTVVSDPAIPASSSRSTPVGLPSATISGSTIYLAYDQYPDVYLATAPVDLSTGWSLDGMILDNAAQSWSGTWVFGPSILCVPGGTFELYVGGDDTSAVRSVAFATSPNGYDWTFDSSLVSGSAPLSTLNHFDALRSRLTSGSYGFWYSKTDSATGLKAVGFAATSARGIRLGSRYCPV